MKKENHPPPGFDPVRLLEIVNIQTEIIKQGLDLGGVLALVADRAHRLMGANGAVVELVDGDDMVYRAAAGVASSLLGLRLKRQGSLSGLSIEEGVALRCDDSETDPRVDRESCRRVGLRSMIVEPLRFNDTPVGVLKVLSSEPDTFSDSDMELLELLAEPIAAAMFFATKHESSDLFHRATHDGLTGLANRAYFYDRFRQLFSGAKESRSGIEVVSFDMDGLKSINDHHGHRAGDAAIKEFASRLLSCMRREDVVARIGGDEFSVIRSRDERLEPLSTLLASTTRTISEPFYFNETKLTLHASAGVAVYPDDGAELDDLLEKADQRMYVEKRERGSRRRESDRSSAVRDDEGSGSAYSYSV